MDPLICPGVPLFPFVIDIIFVDTNSPFAIFTISPVSVSVIACPKAQKLFVSGS